MTPAIVTGVVFVTLLAVCAAVGMVLRDLLTAGASTAGPASIRRPLTVADAQPATTLLGRLNQGFDRLVLESGTRLGSFEVVAVMVIAGVATGCVLTLWRGEPLPIIGGIIWGMTISLTVFAFRRRRRLKQIQEQVPEVLALMSRAVHAGESIEQAVQLAGQETEAPLGEEFRWCARQLELGISVSTAMDSLGRRVRVPGVRILASVLALHRNSGGQLASTLEHLSQVSRARNSYQKQMRAATGAGRISAQFIGAAGPFLFVYFYFFQPDHLRPLLSNPLGNMLLAASAVLYVAGVIWIAQMVQNQER